MQNISNIHISWTDRWIDGWMDEPTDTAIPDGRTSVRQLRFLIPQVLAIHSANCHKFSMDIYLIKTRRSIVLTYLQMYVCVCVLRFEFEFSLKYPITGKYFAFGERNVLKLSPLERCVQCVCMGCQSPSHYKYLKVITTSAFHGRI